MYYVMVNKVKINVDEIDYNLANVYTKWQEDLTETLSEFDGEIECIIDPESNLMVQPAGWTDTSRLEFTLDNRDALIERFLKVRDNCRAILEIGVHRPSWNDPIGAFTSTSALLNNKLSETIYIGIDQDDKSFLNNIEKNVYTIQNNSSHFDRNCERMQELGVTELDFIFIDGWHTINQVKRDWEYTQYLSPTGIVGFHDTTCHPGPKEFVRALDRNKWVVEENVCPGDWGIGFAWKK